MLRLITSQNATTPKQNDEVRDRKIRKYPHEISTAERLRTFGLTTSFVEDEVYEIDSRGKRTGKTISYADLASGMELKTLDDAASINTINGYLKSTSKKKNAKMVVFDNFDNKEMSDDDLIEMINDSRSFRRGRVYIIDHEGNYRYIR